MKNKKIKKLHMGPEGGIHWHEIMDANEGTLEDGFHAHLYVVGGIPVITEFDGEHSHDLDVENNKTKPENQKHTHMIKVGEDLLETESDPDGHDHEIQSQGTTSSGIHKHEMKLPNGDTVVSLQPSDLLSMEIRKNVNLQVQSIFISRDKFATVEEASRFIEEKGFIVGKENIEIKEKGFSFRQLSEERFMSNSLREFEFEPGVIGLVGVIDPEQMDDMDRSSKDKLEDEQAAVDDALSDEQAADLAGLKDEFASQVGSLQTKLNNLIPIVNEFINLSDGLLPDGEFVELLGSFVDGFQHLLNEVNKIELELNIKKEDVEEFETFEKGLSNTFFDLQVVAEIFEDSEGFTNFGALLKKNLHRWANVLEILPALRLEMEETDIAKHIDPNLNFQTVSKNTIKHIKKSQVSHIMIPNIPIDKLQNQDEILSDNLTVLVDKMFEGEDEVSIEIDKDGFKSKFNEDIKLCYNMNEGIPLPNDSIDVVYAIKTLETFDNDKRELIISEIARVLKAGGKFIIESISTENPEAFLPCYKSFWNEQVLDYFQEQCHFQNLNMKTEDGFVNAEFLKLSLSKGMHRKKKPKKRVQKHHSIKKLDKQSKKDESIEYYGDPVNFKFPMDTPKQVSKARLNFKQFADEIYEDRLSKAMIHEIIVKRELELELEPSYNPNDEMDFLLTSDLKKNLIKIDKSLKEKIKDSVGDFIWYNRNLDTTVKKEVKIYKQDDEKEERIIFGEVLVPNDVDAHGDIYDSMTVKDAAHVFMENFGNVGFMHKFFINDEVKVIETFIAPQDMTFQETGGGERNIVKGTWLMKMRVKNDLLWKKVKNGDLTGFSIGGLATVEELKQMRLTLGGNENNITHVSVGL